MQNWITVIISSALVSALVSGITTYLIEKRKYKQEYWKFVINKRLKTYEEIEKIITYFNTTHFNYNKPCHLAFLNIETFNNLQMELSQISFKRNWISPKLYEKITTFNHMCIGLNTKEKLTNEMITKFGTNNYYEISKQRDELLDRITKDYSTLQNVEQFFKKKIKEKKGLFIDPQDNSLNKFT